MGCCHNCEFSKKTNLFDDYECRRRAPVSEKVSASQDLKEWVPRWPKMSSKDWCGEFKERDRE